MKGEQGELDFKGSSATVGTSRVRSATFLKGVRFSKLRAELQKHYIVLYTYSNDANIEYTIFLQVSLNRFLAFSVIMLVRNPGKQPQGLVTSDRNWPTKSNQPSSQWIRLPVIIG